MKAEKKHNEGEDVHWIKWKTKLKDRVHSHSEE